MQEMKPWHEDDTFWEMTAPLLFTHQRWTDAPNQVDGVISLLGIHLGAEILDLCCGVGRHSLELARRGFVVTGVDRTRSYLDQASRQAKTEGLNVEFVQEDMRTFCRPDSFDAAVNLFTSFGYFEDTEEDLQVAANVYRSLKPGGVLLLDTMGKEVLARIFQERNWVEEDGALVLEERKIGRNWGWIDNRWIIIRNGNRKEFKVSHRLYSAVELTSLLTGCSFSRIEAYGDFNGSAYDHVARRLILVAHK